MNWASIIRGDCSVLMLLYKGEHAGTIRARWFRSGNVRAYANIWKGPLANDDIKFGVAKGCGYDKEKAAISEALGLLPGTLNFEKYLQSYDYKILG